MDCGLEKSDVRRQVDLGWGLTKASQAIRWRVGGTLQAGPGAADRARVVPGSARATGGPLETESHCVREFRSPRPIPGLHSGARLFLVCVRAFSSSVSFRGVLSLESPGQVACHHLGAIRLVASGNCVKKISKLLSSVWPIAPVLKLPTE